MTCISSLNFHDILCRSKHYFHFTSKETRVQKKIVVTSERSVRIKLLIHGLAEGLTWSQCSETSPALLVSQDGVCDKDIAKDHMDRSLTENSGTVARSGIFRERLGCNPPSLRPHEHLRLSGWFRSISNTNWRGQDRNAWNELQTPQRIFVWCPVSMGR